MIAALIRACIANRLLVVLLGLAMAGMGVWSMQRIAVDAIPDLSEVQVIIRAEYMGQAPEVVEDQVTYPLTTAMLAVPQARTVRGFSMFGDAFVYVIFADGTDPYWARSRVLEKLAGLGSQLPAGVQPELGPDATGVGWIYQYMLITGRWSPDHPRGLWQDQLTQDWYRRREDAPHPERCELQRIFRQAVVRWVDPANGASWERPELAPPDRRAVLVRHEQTRVLDRDPLTGSPLQEPDVDLAELRSLQDWHLRYELTAIDGVSEVAAVGGFQKQYQVSVDPVVLQAQGLALSELADAIRGSNSDTGGRVIERGETQLVVRSRGYLGDAAAEPRPDESPLDHARRRAAQVIADLGAIAVGRNADGAPLLLRDVAQIAEVPQLRTGMAEWMGEGEAVGGIVVMRQGGNARSTIAAVKERIATLRPNLPPGVDIVTAYDRSDLIGRAIATLTDTLIEEMLIVSLVILVFLLHARSALVAVLVLPAGLLGSLIVMHLAGINANIMSLGGIAVAIGVMDDASVVMVDNLHKFLEEERRRRRRGEPATPWLKLVADASCEVGPTLFFSLLIITISFLPILALGGQSGRLFTPLALTKTFAMAMAAVVSVTLIPVLMSYFITESGLPRHWTRSLRWSGALGIIVGPAVLLSLLPLPAFGAWRWWLVGGWLLLAAVLVLPQKLHDEDRNPLSRLLTAAYSPVFALALRWRWLVVAVSLVVVAGTWLPWSRLGEEFMPPLEEGDFLYMPNTDPGISQTKAREILQQTDRLLAQFPEVQAVMGKIGRSDSATDPAPLTMIETTIMLHRDRNRWRQVPERTWYGSNTTRPITLDELTDGYALPDGQRVPGINEVLRIPGLTGALTRGAMPIRTRIDMLATGIRTPVGLKILGPDRGVLDDLAAQAVQILTRDPSLSARTRSAATERLSGAPYLDLELDRDAIAQAGLAIADVQEVVMGALGGATLSWTVEGRERYPVSLRYDAAHRDSPEHLGRILVPAPDGSQIPLTRLARVVERDGLAMTRSENARPSAWLFITPSDQDLVGYVDAARDVIGRELPLPAGYSLEWSGAFEQIEDAKASLAVAVPLALLAILILLYLATRSWLDTAVVWVGLAFSVSGAIWLVFLLGYEWSLAVSVGVIALLGLDAETTLVMLHYQESAITQARAEGRLRHRADLWQAIRAGAVMRIRPKIMTVVTSFVGLLPLMWADGAGADTMRRLAAPLLGGLISSTAMELIFFPALYAILRGWRLPLEPAIESLSRS